MDNNWNQIFFRHICFFLNNRILITGIAIRKCSWVGRILACHAQSLLFLFFLHTHTHFFLFFLMSAVRRPHALCVSDSLLCHDYKNQDFITSDSFAWINVVLITFSLILCFLSYLGSLTRTRYCHKKLFMDGAKRQRSIIMAALLCYRLSNRKC